MVKKNCVMAAKRHCATSSSRTPAVLATITTLPSRRPGPRRAEPAAGGGTTPRDLACKSRPTLARVTEGRQLERDKDEGDWAKSACLCRLYRACAGASGGVSPLIAGS